MTINGNPAPPAYVVVTNQPYHLHPNEENILKFMIADGFKIPDFGFSVGFISLIDAYKAKEKHSEIHCVLDAMENYQIPVTFDGELPEFVFGETKRTLLIGETYDLGDGVKGILRNGFVSVSEKKAHLVFEVDGNRNSIYAAPLSDDEVSAYQKHPETFFGEIQPVTKNAKTPLDLFSSIYNIYKESPRENLLDWLKDSPDIDELRKKSTEELSLIYVERCVYSVMQQSAQNKNEDKAEV